MNNSEFFCRIEKLPEFDNHQFVGFISDNKIGLCSFIAIHRGGLKNPAFGATRIWNYISENEALRDALKLSKTMSYKGALAGLKYGGAKGVIMGSFPTPRAKKAALKLYAQKINYLNGHFITGADVGISENEVKLMRQESPYIVGVRIDPVEYTILGLYYSIQICLKEIYGKEDTSGHSFAIQGLGKVGLGLVEKLNQTASKIIVSDINPEKIRLAQRKNHKIIAVDPEEIDKQKVDVFSPCALSSCLNQTNISSFNCKIIIGGANSQLENSQIGEILHKLGILYAPDYVVNSGGLISVVDEFENKNFQEKRIMGKLENIKRTLIEIIAASKRKNQATNIVADRLAEKIISKL